MYLCVVCGTEQEGLHECPTVFVAVRERRLPWRAFQAQSRKVITFRGQQAFANPGDWVLLGPGGEVCIFDAETFPQAWELVEGTA